MKLLLKIKNGTPPMRKVRTNVSHCLCVYATVGCCVECIETNHRQVKGVWGRATLQSDLAIADVSYTRGSGMYTLYRHIQEFRDFVESKGFVRNAAHFS